ncbi:MAG: hypothetical protein EP298_01700 [Gammaproteobacteria bacterium]|nr:MAG: hypothetical protein EP298_01700 [Gammaproteobacteria bacterium]
MKNYHNSKNWISFVKKLLEDNGQNYHYFQELINDIDFQQAIININHLKNKFDSSHLDRLRHDDVIKGINLLSNYGKINFQQFELIVNNHRLAECIAFLVDQSIIYNKNNFISSCQGFINFIMNNIDTINELKIEVVKNNISLDSADWDNLNNANIQSSLKRFIQLKSNINEKSNPLSCHYILSNIVQFEKLELVCQNEEIKQLIYKNYYLYESIISLEDHYFPQHCNRSDYFNTIKNLLQNSELTKNLINLYKNQSFNNLLVNHFSKIASIVNNEEDITFLKNINLYSIEQIDQYNKLKALDQKGILKNIQNINAKQSLITYSNYRDSEIFIKYINSIKDEKFNYLKECIEQCIKNYTKDDKLKELVNHIQYIIKIDSNLTDLINKLKSKISNPIKAKNITDENRDNYINNVIPIILNKDISKTERDSQIIQQSKKFIIDTQLSKDKSTTSKIARYFMLGITNTAYILTIVGPIVSYCVNKNNHFKNTNQKIFPFYRNTKSKNLMNQEVSNKIFNL